MCVILMSVGGGVACLVDIYSKRMRMRMRDPVSNPERHRRVSRTRESMPLLSITEMNEDSEIAQYTPSYEVYVLNSTS